MEVAKNDGALDGMANQLQGFTQATSHSLETVRQTVDEKLAQAVAESRTGRTELLAAFAAFEAQLAQRLAALDAAQSLALSSFRTELTGTLGTMSGALRDQLDGNGNQIRNQFTVLQESLSQQLASLVQGSQQGAEAAARCAERTPGCHSAPTRDQIGGNAPHGGREVPRHAGAAPGRLLQAGE
jgi:DNA recombination protein RmuC